MSLINDGVSLPRDLAETPYLGQRPVSRHTGRPGATTDTARAVRRETARHKRGHLESKRVSAFVPVHLTGLVPL